MTPGAPTSCWNFSAGVIAASRRFARRSGESDFIIHGRAACCANATDGANSTTASNTR